MTALDSIITARLSAYESKEALGATTALEDMLYAAVKALQEEARSVHLVQDKEGWIVSAHATEEGAEAEASRINTEQRTEAASRGYSIFPGNYTRTLEVEA